MVFMDIYGPTQLAVVLLASTPSHKQKLNTMTTLLEAAPKGSVDMSAIIPLVAPPKAPKAPKAPKVVAEKAEEEETKAEAPVEVPVAKQQPKKAQPEKKSQQKGGKRARSATVASN
eukprot:TRINITY_DN2779_c0_g1_i7.p1 TRINITY_DN2779_c0_g1~~TRINITY_DN2779_c0_g1_i7.p1  ORF type:complete len:116 (-),score=53.13 TRINITY_DN2779_c0_g1_i7:251-598(-)